MHVRNYDSIITLFILQRSDFWLFRICRSPTGAQWPRNTICSGVISFFDAICCIPPLPRDRSLSTRKGRCGYSVRMVHFRKVVIRQKVGSSRNGHSVI
ncbi:hypothetical protein C2U50_01665 (plasmid) [Klebsiella pneumoniae]|nr:hypothetical protein C2U50_01665 [Klebsiella pneumoniae]